ncbi:MAG: class I SAM-dependent methyltransferase [Planctomycetota bacterium]
MLARVYDLLRRASGPRTRAWFKRQRWFVPVTRVLFGTGVYSESYFESIERIEADSVRAMARWIRERLAPARAIDVGCGPGHMMQAMAAEGIAMKGVDIADAALRRSREKGLDVERFDLTASSELPGRPYDLVVCCEVAEHLEAKHARQLVRTLCAGGDTVFMTAAEPDPSVGPGLHHVNEQPNAYWIALMADEGFALDEAQTADARARFAAAGVIVYLQRAMVFRRR